MGYLRARRSIKLGPGVKVNLNKHSVGVTVGARGAHYSVNSRGQRTRTVGIPGSGLSYINRTSATRSTRRPASRARTAAPAIAAAQAHPHPGLFARHYEKAFFHGTEKVRSGQIRPALADFKDADESDDKHRAISPAFFCGVLTAQLGDHAGAIPYLERVTRSAQELPDDLMRKYAHGLTLTITVDGRISIPIHVGSLAATMQLAQSYAEWGRLTEAIGLLQQLHEHVAAQSLLLFLVSLYRKAEEWDEIVHATAGVVNEDNASLILRLWQAEAMERENLPDAALEVYRDALRSTKRDPQLLKEARYARAALYTKLGKKAMAKRDLGRLMADDPGYKDVADLLRGLA